MPYQQKNSVVPSRQRACALHKLRQENAKIYDSPFRRDCFPGSPRGKSLGVQGPKQVEEITGYSVKTVNHWCAKEELKCFLIFNKFQIPKEYLIDFMVSERCILIAKKSQKHIKMLTEAMEYINARCASKK